MHLDHENCLEVACCGKTEVVRDFAMGVIACVAHRKRSFQSRLKLRRIGMATTAPPAKHLHAHPKE